MLSRSSKERRYDPSDGTAAERAHMMAATETPPPPAVAPPPTVVIVTDPNKVRQHVRGAVATRQNSRTLDMDASHYYCFFGVTMTMTIPYHKRNRSQYKYWSQLDSVVTII